MKCYEISIIMKYYIKYHSRPCIFDIFKRKRQPLATKTSQHFPPSLISRMYVVQSELIDKFFFSAATSAFWSNINIENCSKNYWQQAHLSCNNNKNKLLGPWDKARGQKIIFTRCGSKIYNHPQKMRSFARCRPCHALYICT